MQFSKKIFVTVAAVPLALAMGGCASRLIGERVGSDQIAVAQATQVATCKPLGRSTVSVLSALGPITRSAEAVEDNLLQMARNEAVDKGADTVVKGNSMQYGTRSYEFYKCKP